MHNPSAGPSWEDCRQQALRLMDRVPLNVGGGGSTSAEQAVWGAVVSWLQSLSPPSSHRAPTLPIGASVEDRGIPGTP